MVTDDERREIARKLRKKYEERCARTMEPQDVFIQYYNYLKDLESCLPDCKSMFTLLADLIEPSESGHDQDKNGTCRDESGQCPKSCPEMSGIEPDTRKSSEPTRKCDRDALLELSDEMKRCIYLSPKKCKEVHRGWSNRIRDALEVKR